MFSGFTSILQSQINTILKMKNLFFANWVL